MKKTLPLLLLFVFGAAACQQDMAVDTFDTERSVTEDIIAAKKVFYEHPTLYNERALLLEAAGKLLRFVGSLVPYKDGTKALTTESINTLHRKAQEVIAKAEGRPYQWMIEQQVSLKMLEWVILKSPVPVDDATTLYYVGMLVNTMSPEFSILLAAFDNTRDRSESVHVLAEKARINRMALAEIADNDEDQGSLRNQLSRQDLDVFDARIVKFTTSDY